MPDVSVRVASANDLFSVARLCWAYRAFLLERSVGLPPIVDTYYGETSYAALIEDLPRIHARPRGDILVATRSDQIVGCAMYYPISQSTCEIKRVYVDAAARRSGAGRLLMEAGMKRAKSDGYARMVLDTLETLTEAQALYARVGFVPCAPFYEPNPDFEQHLRFFDIQL